MPIEISLFTLLKISLNIPNASHEVLTKNARSNDLILDNQLRANCVKSFLIVKKPFWPQVMPYSQAHILLICAMISLRMICHAESWYASIMEKNAMNGSPDSNPN